MCGVWCGTLKNPMCRVRTLPCVHSTSPCVPATRPHALRLVGGFAHTQRGVLNVHTEAV